MGVVGSVAGLRMVVVEPDDVPGIYKVRWTGLSTGSNQDLDISGGSGGLMGTREVPWFGSWYFTRGQLRALHDALSQDWETEEAADGD